MSGQPSPLRRGLAILLWAAPLALALSIPNLGPVAAVLLVIGVVIFRRDARQAALPLWRWSPAASLAFGAVAGAALHLFVSSLFEPFLARQLGGGPDLSAFAAVEGNVAAYMQLLAIGILFGGLAEELVFRGYAVGWGSALFGARWALPLAIASGAAFGVAHSYQGPAGMITTGVIGLTYGIVYLLAGRRLAPAIAAHITLNVLGITELYLGRPLIAPLIGP